MDDFEAIKQSRLRLKEHVEMSVHTYRGVSWCVLSDSVNTTNFRCTMEASAFLERLRDRVTVGEALEHVTAGDTPPNDEDVVRLLVALKEADLLTGEFAIDPNLLRSKAELTEERRLLSKFARPLSFKLAHLNPASLLSLLAPRTGWLFDRRVAWLFLLLAISAGIAGIAVAGDLTRHFSSRFTDPVNLLTLWFLYPLIKLLHELGHGLACRRFGGEVREMGIMLLVLVPVPYVDASASTAFPNRYHRMVVAGAGIMVEVTLAACALFFWIWTGPGIANDIAFNIALVAGVSTLIFNGNPLLKFDGYYVLTDVLEIPALASRSNQYLGYLVRHHLLNHRTARSPVMASGEAGWFVAYGISAGLYRLFISFTIAMLIASRFFVLGLLLACWFLLLQIIMPAVRGMRQVLIEARDEERLAATALRLGGAVSIVAVLLLVPVPDSSWSEGVIVPPEEAVTRTRVEGFAVSLPEAREVAVEAGDVVLRLVNDQIDADIANLEARLTELQTRFSSALGNDAMLAGLARERLQVVEQRLAEMTARRESMELRVEEEGLFRLALHPDQIDQYMARGTLVGYLVTGESATARLALRREDVERVVGDTREIVVQRASRPREIMPASLSALVPRATTRLASRALGTAGGGSVSVDMSDPSGLTALAEVFEVQVEIPRPLADFRVGERVFVRFQHGGRPLGGRIVTIIRQYLDDLSTN